MFYDWLKQFNCLKEEAEIYWKSLAVGGKITKTNVASLTLKDLNDINIPGPVAKALLKWAGNEKCLLHRSLF